MLQIPSPARTAYPRRLEPARSVDDLAVDARTLFELSGLHDPSTRLERLPYSDNSLGFRFFASGYVWRHSPTYEFRLNRSVGAWTTLGSGSVLTLPELSEGTYQLEVRLANQSHASSQPLRLEFAIAPPWYRTWYAYSLYVLGAGAAVLGLMAWSTRRARARSERLERLVDERTGELKHTMEKLGEETKNAAVLAERTRLASDIHDSLQQGLTGIMLQLEATLKLPAVPDEVRSRLSVARNMASYSRQEVQSTVWDMASPLLHGTALEEALRKIATLISPGFAEIAVETHGPQVPLSASLEHHLLRIAQEAVTNAVRHGAPTRIEIRLDYDSHSIALTIRDNGAGFAPDAVLSSASLGHFGLRGLRHRAEKIGADLRIESAPGRGTTIFVRAPRDSPAETHS